MPVEEIAQQHYRTQQVISRKTVNQAQVLWSQVEAPSLLDSWLALLAEMLRILTAGQAAVAAQAQPYLAALAAAQAIPPAALAVAPLAFAGVAADGRALASLLMQPALKALGLLAAGADDRDALRSGLASLTRIIDTEVSDASRAASQVGMTANRNWVSYVRVVNLPACGRCIILAGVPYKYSTGFQRHERCDCEMLPLAKDSPERLALRKPKELFADMSAAEQDKAFGKAGAEAVRLGGDMGQVVNARRKMTKTRIGDRDVLTTSVGTTWRSFAGRRMISEGAETFLQAEELVTRQTRRGPEERQVHRRRVVAPRLMPETLLASTDDRDEQIRLLYSYGFLVRMPES